MNEHPITTARTTDEQLAARIGTGDATAWRKLFDRHAPAVRRWLDRHTFGDEDEFLIDGIIDEVFGDARHFAAFARRASVHGAGASLLTYLCAIARHKLCHHRKHICRAKAALGAVRSLDAVDAADDSHLQIGTTDRAFVRIDARDTVEQLCRHLAPIDREICDGIAHGHSMDEIAARIGTTTTAATVRWHRLRQKLRDRYAHLSNARPA